MPVYSQSQQAIQAQIPQTQAMYDTLLQALQTQAGTEAQGIIESAAQRGLSRPTLAQDVGSTLNDAVSLEQARLNAARAGDLASIGTNLGELGVNRVTSATDLANTIQEQDLATRRNREALSKLQQEYVLDRQKIEREFEINLVQARREAAAQRAKGSELTSSQALLAINQLWKPGKDGYVNPEQWNKYREAFMKAGYSGSAFDSEFGVLVNPVHQYRESKLPRYKGIGLKD